MSSQWIDSNPSSDPLPAPHDVVPAGFLRRWAALFLDQLILSAGFYALMFVVIFAIGIGGGFESLESMDSDDPPAWVIALYFGTTLIYVVVAGLYYSLMESSAAQATLGKMALSIKVVDSAGARLSFPHALGRWFAASLSYLTFYVGFLMAAFTQEKRALHDYVAGTAVVDKWAYTDRPELQQRKPGGCLIAVFVGMALMIGVAVLGIVAAIAIPAYQQYASRAQIASVHSASGEWKKQVLERLLEQEDPEGIVCPRNGDDGFGSPESYARQGVNRVVFDEFEHGLCGISIWIPPVTGNVERQILLEVDPQTLDWYCTTTLPDSIASSFCK